MNIKTNLLAIEINVVITAVIVILAIAVVLGLLLAVASKFLKIEQDNRIEKVTELLPG